MKKIFALSVALLLCAALAVGCAVGSNGGLAPSESPVQIPNPVT